MADNINYKKITQEAVEEVVEDLKKEGDSEKIDEIVKTIDAVNMITKIVQDTIERMNLDPEKLGEQGIKEIAKKSAEAAISAGIKK